MPRTRKPPRLMHWNGDWHIFYFDRASNKTKRVLCRALNANTARERKNRLARYLERDTRDRMADAGLSVAEQYDYPLSRALGEFRERVNEREKARIDAEKIDPDTRQGLSKGAAYMLRAALGEFEAWLAKTGLKNMLCGQLDGPTLERFSTHLATKDKSAATSNITRDRLRTCLIWLSRRRPKLFPDPEILWPALALVPVEPRDAVAHTPKELRAFLKAARSLPDTMTVKRKRGGKWETFEARKPKVTATPADRVFLLLACTGCRLEEALLLKWADVDLERGRIKFWHALKRGETRYLPLTKSAERIEVAPRFLKLLKAWRKEDPKRVYVLPHRGTDMPVFPKKEWARLRRKFSITPQTLRQNFTSYAASLGVPASVCADWQGHDVQVAEDHYRLQVLERIDADSMEAAMGLATSSRARNAEYRRHGPLGESRRAKVRRG